MEAKLKQKLLRTNPFVALEKIIENSQKVARKLFEGASLVSTNLRTKETKSGGYSLFKHVRVNYPYWNRIQPELYRKPNHTL